MQAAGRFRALLTSSPKSQDQIADEIGVTQGAVWQWAEGKVAISAKRAVAAARAVGGRPEEISVAFRDVISQERALNRDGQPLASDQTERHNAGQDDVKGLVPLSQSLRLDAERLAKAFLFSKTYLAAQGVTGAVDAYPHVVAFAYGIIAAIESQDSKAELVEVLGRMADEFQEAPNDVRADGGRG